MFHGLWACLWCSGLAVALLSAKQVDVACLVSSKDVICLQGKSLRALQVLLSLLSVQVLQNCLGSPAGAEQGLLFGAMSSPAVGVLLHARCDLFCGKSWEKPTPELLVRTGHPAAQLSCGPLASRLTCRDVPLITVISAAPLPRSALSCSSRHSPGTLGRVI